MRYYYLKMKPSIALEPVGGFASLNTPPSFSKAKNTRLSNLENLVKWKESKNLERAMSVKKSLDERMEEAEKKLLQLKAQAALKKRREKRKVAEAQKRQKFAEAFALTRQEDAHRKIELGGVVIAAGADNLDPAELCGLLLLALRQITPDRLPELREVGLAHFEARKAAREQK